MGRKLLGLTTLLLFSGVLCIQDSEAGARRRRCHIKNAYAAQQPCRPLDSGPIFCNTSLFMNGNPPSYYGNHYDSSSVCTNPVLTMCTGDSSVCGSPGEKCKDGDCVAARLIKGASDYYGYNCVIQNGTQLPASYSHLVLDAKLYPVPPEFSSKPDVDAYCDSNSGIQIRIFKFNHNRTGGKLRFGFEVADGNISGVTTKLQPNDCDVQPVPGNIAGLQHVKEVKYNNEIYVVITAQ